MGQENTMDLVNKSGIEPAGHRVLVLPEEVKEKTDGGIYLPQQAKDREQAAVIVGTLVAVGPQAWDGFGDGKPWAGVGDDVIFAKYGGAVVKGIDGKEYRILNDEDIVGVQARLVK